MFLYGGGKITLHRKSEKMGIWEERGKPSCGFPTPRL